ncbi:MAG: potassium transporter Kup [Nitratireductor sp.]|nr:potassium transporter Kup [Nitratireductor sp.]
MALALGAIGVVYGDIGTSPLYAFREALRAVSHDQQPTEIEVIGILSIILWSLTLIVTVKYIGFVLRADNKGEGGTLTIMTLAREAVNSRYKPLMLGLGIVGAALFFGDALITPAISVLSAVEGLKVVSPGLDKAVVPLTLVILIALFSIQGLGTGRVAAIFGPLTATWFIALGITGAVHIFDHPYILSAINPYMALYFLATHPGVAFAVMGAAFLAVTGAEALYVDLGHFGRRPIRLAWFALVFPCLVINYFGQGAFVIASNKAIEQPLFEMVPAWAALPMVILATLATIIASQAVISGAFSLTRQAVQLQLLPRFEVRHTSEQQSGQIFLPRVNTLLLLGVLLLVVSFGSSESLAAAYGISVTGEMLVTSVLLFVVARRMWKRPLWLALLIVVPIAMLEVVFLSANLAKFLDGGFVSIFVAAMMIVIMWTWVRGSSLLAQKTRKAEVPLQLLADQLVKKPPHRVPGSAVFLTSDIESAPTALLHSLKHYKVLHEQNVILSVKTMPTPRVSPENRVVIDPINDLFSVVTVKYGYMEEPNLPKALGIARKLGWKYDIMSTSFFLSRRSLKASVSSGMPLWQDKLFIRLARSASDATEYFRIPTGRVVEIGTQVVV